MPLGDMFDGEKRRMKKQSKLKAQVAREFRIQELEESIKGDLEDLFFDQAQSIGDMVREQDFKIINNDYTMFHLERYAMSNGDVMWEYDVDRTIDLLDMGLVGLFNCHESTYKKRVDTDHGEETVEVTRYNGIPLRLA